MAETRFCPLHGDYDAEDGAGCPQCARDPLAAKVSLRAVRVVNPASSGADVQSGNDEQTPIDDTAPCPSCDREIPLGEFQVEASGEVWEGPAALWAEEGVCFDCYRNVLPQHIRRWTNDEWLAHHFEGWAAHLKQVADIAVREGSPQDSWLPEERRHLILDVEKTLAARREHLARSQMRARELKQQYGAAVTPQPFRVALEQAREALGAAAVGELKAARATDLEAGADLRSQSVMLAAPLVARAAEVPPEASPSRWPYVAIGVLVTAFFVWWWLR